jgi:hypothetical protein
MAIERIQQFDSSSGLIRGSSLAVHRVRTHKRRGVPPGSRAQAALPALVLDPTQKTKYDHPMTGTHPLLQGLEAIGRRSHDLPDKGRLFSQMFEQIRSNWTSVRTEDRWPSPANWVLPVAPDFTQHPTQNLEKQLQKNIAIHLENEGWGNGVPTASGLTNDRGRQMNIDLAHRIPDGSNSSN